MYAFKDVALVTPGGVIENGVLVTEEDRIRALGPEADVPVPSQAQVIDGQGMYLAPGFIELQLNGGFGEDFTDNPDSIWRVAAQLPRYGVTSFLPTIITCGEDTLNHALGRWVARRVTTSACGSLGLHVEGPFQPGEERRAQPGVHHRTRRKARRTGRLRLAFAQTLAPELPGAHEVIGGATGWSAPGIPWPPEEAMRPSATGSPTVRTCSTPSPADHRRPG